MDTKGCRILCFGDSLTSGYVSFGLEYHPYSVRLEQRLREARPSAKDQIFTDGEPGELASSIFMKNRLRNELRARSYDWVIILGGTNDIGGMRSGADTFKALEELWALALASGSKVLALTVPDCSMRVAWLDEARTELNQKILSHEAPNFFAFDLQTHIPIHSLSEDEKDERWADGLHLTETGYDWMGDKIANGFLPLLQRQGNLAKSKPKTKAKSSDQMTYEEEQGNSKDISQGYVVVRKKDLD